MARGEGIKKLSSLFDRYKHALIAPERSVITCFCEVVEDLYGWQLKTDIVSYQPNTKTLQVRASGVFKTEIQLHKEEILTHMKGRLGVKNTPKEIF
jgi:hypothetical protein